MSDQIDAAHECAVRIHRVLSNVSLEVQLRVLAEQTKRVVREHCRKNLDQSDAVLDKFIASVRS